MKRRAERDDLTMAYMRYLATWLHSWSTRRKFEFRRQRRPAAEVTPVRLHVVVTEHDPSVMRSDEPRAATA
ncbi:hypothetical protein GCM10023321_60510 [Pseudonocardia eucalypti]|uniref:Uncharacterized protein n=1 Tax=Pseudonocardia eucalypti TaxID=648755 RepID=A0ABP9QTZ9_9PSEU|nr:hypothetical protein [Pseudonocardia eucalypti]